MALIVRLATVLSSSFHSARISSTRTCIEIPPEDSPLHRRFAPSALMLGNIVTGRSVLAPAGRIIELSSGLDVAVPRPRGPDLRCPTGSRGVPAPPRSTPDL